MTGLLAAIVATSASALAQSADPFAGIPNLTFRYYELTASDGSEINAAIMAQGPRGETGGRGAGRTDYHIAYGWTETKSFRSCQVTNVRARFSAVVHLPRLADETRLPAPARVEWRQISAVLRVHEAGHARIAYDHIDEVWEAVSGAPCGKERMRGQAVVDRIARLQADYDRRTAHGLAQGDITR